MPEYQNNNAVPIQIKGPNGGLYLFEPGESKAIGFYTDDARLTFVSDLPYYNRLIDDDVVSLTGVYQDVTISLLTKYVVFLGSSGSTVTAYAQSETNDPPELRDHDGGNVVIPIPASGRFNKMRVAGSGTWRVVQYRK